MAQGGFGVVFGVWVGVGVGAGASEGIGGVVDLFLVILQLLGQLFGGLFTLRQLLTKCRMLCLQILVLHDITLQLTLALHHYRESHSSLLLTFSGYLVLKVFELF